MNSAVLKAQKKSFKFHKIQDWVIWGHYFVVHFKFQLSHWDGMGIDIYWSQQLVVSTIIGIDNFWL